MSYNIYKNVTWKIIEDTSATSFQWEVNKYLEKGYSFNGNSFSVTCTDTARFNEPTLRYCGIVYKYLDE